MFKKLKNVLFGRNYMSKKDNEGLVMFLQHEYKITRFIAEDLVRSGEYKKVLEMHNA